jgi:membrane protein DedA with SNARE-associated domain
VEWIHQFIGWYMSQVDRIGWELYILLGMFIESSFIPFPSEIIMPPAGHQAGSVARLVWFIALGTLGSLLGAWVNYFLGAWLGRPFFVKYGKYLLVNEKKLAKMDAFWAKYGEGSTFICRLIPAVRQLVSVPAGISRMNFWKFTLFTGLGAGFWVSVLALAGWMLRDWTARDFEEKLRGEMLPYVIALVALLIMGYVVKIRFWNRRR